MRILITGSNGQLGSEIRDLASLNKTTDFIFTDLHDLDICDFNALNNFITEQKITGVINCAAYTNVDKAEENSEIVEKVNSEGVSNLVNALKAVNGKLIHISTDYVFDGENSQPYNELDPVNPIGVYGKSKRGGELAVINSSMDGIVIRTSWLYSSYGDNFVKKILDLGLEKKELRIVFDQLGTPTYAKDLAKICLNIICKNSSNKISEKRKIYNYSNEGIASWFDFASEIIKLGKIVCKVIPVLTKEFPTKSKRPHYSVLDKTNIKNDFNIEIPYWRDSLKACILKINKNKDQ
jgi:dTDP-4-dehydrorhamnose reductase